MRSLTPLSSESKIILCIDDNEELLECEKAFLESFGYTVLTAPTGNEGLKLALRHAVDVVIVDYVMPEMDGQEVAVEMRRVQPNATIIMLSGDMEVPEAVFNMVDAFVTKDRLASELLPAIAQLQVASEF